MNGNSKEYRQMLKIHAFTEKKMQLEKYFFDNPDKMWLRIEKPTERNLLLNPYSRRFRVRECEALRPAAFGEKADSFQHYEEA